MISGFGSTARAASSLSARVMANIWRCFAQISAAARYFLQGPRASVNTPVSAAAPDAEIVAAAPVHRDVNDDPDVGINSIAPTVADQQEIERRRNLVRLLFNDFWSGVSDKPAAFVDRLNQAEDYLNERLAANGEFWRLDAETRVMLGLPPRSNPLDRGRHDQVDRRHPMP
jgi:hypothetical protein